MPFQSITSPAISLGLLKSGLVRRNIDCHVHYLNLRFASLVGPDLYEAVADQWFIGELLFSKHLLGEINRHDLRSVIVPESVSARRNRVIRLDELQSLVSTFLTDCLRSVNWSTYSIIGFTVAYQQIAPALCLARLVKQRWPDARIVFGGPSCQEEMGAEILRQYEFVDCVFSGEADETFPEFVCRHSEEISDQFNGVVRRDRSGATVLPTRWTAPVMTLDSLPCPDYDDYFEQLGKFKFRGHAIKVGMPLETSRGCWWGERSKCTFCGFNGSAISYRSKSPDRVLDEINFLTEKYGDRFSGFEVVDSILDLRYFTSLFPRLAKASSIKPIFAYTKANLTKLQVRLLARARVWGIEPGIENLSTPILRLMNKGCSMLQNIQLLKWCREFDMRVAWNLLYGIPNEDPAEYDRIQAVIDCITHLQPPCFVWKIAMHRFSPLFEDPRRHGITNIRPNPWYREIFALADQSLARMAYTFEFDYEDMRNPDAYVKHLKENVERWRHSFPESKFLARRDAEGLLITKDTRPYVHSCEGKVFESPYADIMEYCDQTRHFSAVESYLRNKNLNCPAQQLKDMLANLVESQIVLEDEENYLSLPILLGEAH